MPQCSQDDVYLLFCLLEIPTSCALHTFSCPQANSRPAWNESSIWERVDLNLQFCGRSRQTKKHSQPTSEFCVRSRFPLNYRHGDSFCRWHRWTVGICIEKPRKIHGRTTNERIGISTGPVSLRSCVYMPTEFVTASNFHTKFHSRSIVGSDWGAQRQRAYLTQLVFSFTSSFVDVFSFCSPSYNSPISTAPSSKVQFSLIWVLTRTVDDYIQIARSTESQKTSPPLHSVKNTKNVNFSSCIACEFFCLVLNTLTSLK